MSFYRDELGLNVKRIDAQSEFLAVLEGLVDPVIKEQRIFALLNQVVAREVAAMPDVRLLLEGTNYSDALASDENRPVPPDGVPHLIEPLRELFKDEIRRVGEELQLPPAIINRQPFPGSGLALRILSDVTQERLTLLREADDIFRNEIEAAGQSRRLWQYFATLANDPVPGAEGYVITLRAVQVIEGDLGVASRLPYDLLERVTETTLTRLPAIHRVLYDFTPSQSYARSRG